jgi:hypothetical protein
MKTAFYTRYQDILGFPHPARIILVDGMNPEMVSCIDATGWMAGDLPGRWFEPDNLRSTLAALPLPPQKPAAQGSTGPADRP